MEDQSSCGDIEQNVEMSRNAILRSQAAGQSASYRMKKAVEWGIGCTVSSPVRARIFSTSVDRNVAPWHPLHAVHLHDKSCQRNSEVSERRTLSQSGARNTTLGDMERRQSKHNVHNRSAVSPAKTPRDVSPVYMYTRRKRSATFRIYSHKARGSVLSRRG